MNPTSPDRDHRVDRRRRDVRYDHEFRCPHRLHGRQRGTSAADLRGRGRRLSRADRLRHHRSRRRHRQCVPRRAPPSRDRGDADVTTTIDQIDLQIAEIRSEAALLGNGVEFVEPPRSTADARILPALQYMIAGLLFAAFATAIIAWFRAGRRPLVGSSSDVTTSLDAPLLGEVTDAPAGHFDSCPAAGGFVPTPGDQPRRRSSQRWCRLDGDRDPEPPTPPTPWPASRLRPPGRVDACSSSTPTSATGA